jgi:signal transduction histidine kinase
MRLLIFELRPPLLQKDGLVAALEARLETVEGRAGLETEFSVKMETQLAPKVEEGLYRIAQEALNNILRHANASHISISIRQQDGNLTMEVQDNGTGFDPILAREKGGLGLCSMEERAIQLYGSLDVESETGTGTCVRVTVPCTAR